MSERGEGEWRFDGRFVRLTSKPMPKAPTFELLRDDPAPAGELTIIVEPLSLGWGGSLDGVARAANGDELPVETDSAGRIDTRGRDIASIELMVPVYGTSGGRFALAPGRGHRLLLRFHANDLGTAAFEAEPLGRDGGDLVMTRYGTKIRFVRIRP